MSCPTCGQPIDHIAARVRIYGMYNCHLFHKIKGSTVDEIIANWEAHNREEHPARFLDGEGRDIGPSCLCPAIVISSTDKELRRVGEVVSPRPIGTLRLLSLERYDKELAAYRQALLDDPDISRLLEKS